MDLSQAESVMELISAKSEKAAELSLQSMEGRFSKEIQNLKLKMIELLAYMEAFLDFPEEDLPATDQKALRQRLDEVLQTSMKIKKQSESSSVLRHGIEVAILGPANAGKSSLFNEILGKERAIVSHHPGTTRDFLDAEIIHDGILIRFTDTAGLREQANEIEQLGQAKGLEKGQAADLLLFILDGSESPTPDIIEIWKKFPKDRVILVKNKKDLSEFKKDLGPDWHGDWPEYEISAKNHLEIESLMDGIFEFISKKESKDNSAAFSLLAEINSMTLSACDKSIRPFKYALLVNSPDSAGRIPF